MDMVGLNPTYSPFITTYRFLVYTYTAKTVGIYETDCSFLHCFKKDWIVFVNILMGIDG